MPDEDKKEEHGKKKDFGEGIEVVKDQPKEERDIEINFGSILSMFGKKKKTAIAGAEGPARTEHKGHHRQEEKHEATAAKKEDESEIDLKKLTASFKGIFKGKEAGEKRSPETARRGEDEVSINLKSVSEFFSTKGAMLLLILGILISVGMTMHVRLQPAQLPFTEEWARNSVYNTIQSDVNSAISQQYPNLPQDRRNQIINEELDKARNSKSYTFKTGQYAGQQIRIDDQIKGTGELIKDFYQDENEKPYSPDIDPYYWYRYAKNIVEKGHIGDEVRNGVQWDTYQLAPFGRPIAAQDVSFPYFIAYLYKATRIFNPSATLWGVQTTAYPMLITGLTVLLIFLIARKIAGNVGGFFAAVMAGLHSAYVNRTIHGDNDSFVIFIAILTLWLFVEAIYANKAKWKIALAAGAGLAAALFSLAWGGWWFILIFMLASSAATIGAGTIKTAVELAAKKRSATEIAKGAVKSAITGTVGKLFTIPTAIFFASTAVFVSLFTGVERFLQTPLLALGITQLKTAVLAQSYWPNVLTTVAELNEGNFNQVVSSIKPGIFWLSFLSAGLLLAIAAINLGLPYISNRLRMVKSDEKKALYSLFFATLMIIWFIGTIYATTKGIRFVLLLAPAVGLGFGITLGLAFRLSNWLNENFLKINKLAVSLAIFAILAVATYSTDVSKDAYRVARNDIPIINDAWYNSLTAIRDDSDNITKSAVITSWWDFGHHFKAIADRRVTFDGTTQQGPQAHWVGKFFMTKNETEAIGILRMLNCGSDSGFNAINSLKNNFEKSIKITDQLTRIQARKEAESVLVEEHGLTQEQARNITEYTHCNPPESYVIASEDMIGKSGVWGHFGSWDFERGIIWETLKGKSQKEAVEQMKERFGYSEEKAKSIYNEIARIRSDGEANSWIAPWPSFSGEISGCQPLTRVDNTTNTEEKLALCGNGLVVNITTSDAYFPTQDGKTLHPVTFVYLSNETGTEKVVEREYQNDTIPQRFSAILAPQGSAYYTVVASPEQAAGMFTKMFFFEGKDLKHFKQLVHNTGFTGTNVYVYKADWESIG